MTDFAKKTVDAVKPEVSQQPLHIHQSASLQHTRHDVLWAQVRSKRVEVHLPEQGPHGRGQLVRQGS